jgi:hypothetical protein
MRQLPVTVVADVDREQLAPLRRLLQSMGQDPGGNVVVPLAQLPGTHFARFVLLDAATGLDGAPVEPHLVYMADIDAPLDERDPASRHLGELVDVAGAALDRLLARCAGYPTKRRGTRARRLSFLVERRVEPAAAYVNTVGRSVRQILDEEQLRVMLGRFLDEKRDWSRHPPADVRASIQDYVEVTPALAWARTRAPTPDLAHRVRGLAGALAPPAAVAALSPLLAPAVPAFAVLLRREELRDPAPHIAPKPDHVRRLAALEDHTTQNQFSAVGDVKQGLVRRVTIGVVTRALDYSARVFFNHADLAGVKTIHFARWVFLDDGRRMIFASNYDGSVESYNDDFIDKVWWGLNAVFSNGYGWPKTTLLFFGGARREQEFKDYLRVHQVPTQVWYAAYPDLSAVNVDDNAAIRAGLYGEMTAEEARRWLQLI